MNILNHRAEGAAYRAANAFGGALKPTLIVVHDTAGRLDKGSTITWFASKDCGTSAHVVVERDGTLIQMVPFDRKAYHAGVSEWKGRSSCNAFAIGIEIVNPGICDKNGRAWFHKTSKDPKKWQKGYPLSQLTRKKTKEHGDGWWMDYTPEQIKAVTELCQALAQAYPIEDITAHYVISPGRKIDTNPLFPLDQVREEAFRVKGEAEVVALEPMAPEPAGGMLEKLSAADRSFALVNSLADQGSRLAQGLRGFKQWFWKLAGFGSAGTTVLMTADTSGGAGAVVASNPTILWVLFGLTAGAAVTGLAAYLYVKFRIEPGIISAAKDGRYEPRGGQ